MTDWLPWGGALMVGTLATLGLTLRSLQRTPVGQAPDLGAARKALVATAVVTAVLYALYLALDEDWLWYT